jgi:two-component system sensor histidine kinase QseC
VSQCPIKEDPRPVDLTSSLREAIIDTSRLAARQGAQVQLEESPAIVQITRPQVFTLLTRTLLEHAILATPKGGNVWISFARKDHAIVLRVEDSGTFVPPISRADLFELRVDPSSLGRPVGIQLVAAQAAATYLGGSLELSEGNSGGMAFECELPMLE